MISKHKTSFFCAAFLAATWVATGRGDEPAYKLKPLAYNHPGLEVDLGVGLWAYPMPVDYDNDGDMDLLVSCPDKPSRGTYYFENPSNDSSVKNPVFKPGVRVGQGHHYMLLSRVNDQAVALIPGKEFRRDADSGKFDFTKSTKIPVTFVPNDETGGRTRGNMWRYVDYDGDGDHDITVGVGDWSDLGWDHAYDNQGRWRNGPLHGYVFLIKNDGNDEQPDYSKSPRRLTAAGSEIDVYGWPCPNFADFDDDGDLDLLCGEFMDGFNYFQNIGSRTEPEYAAGVKLRDAQNKPLVMHLQMITPTACDWDSDEDIDLIVGDEDGRVALVENTGDLRDGHPVFLPPSYFRQQADTLKFGALATPFAFDWDQDGDEDILCGNTAGSIGFFENLGGADTGLPMWAAPRLLEVNQEGAPPIPFRVMAGPSGSIQGPCEAKWGYTTLSVADWDGDGDGDILYNSILARVGLLLGDNGLLTEKPFDTGLRESPPAWYGFQPPSSATLTQWRTTPLAMDFDQDGHLDLVMMDQQGYLNLRRRGGIAERIFIDEDNQPFRLTAGTCGRSGRIKLAMTDWDGDSRVDLIVNSENATWYRNCETRDGKLVLKKVGNLAKRNVAGHTSSPAICDFDRDGKPDLLVGSENGRIYHIAHDDCESFTTAQTTARQPTPPKPAKFPGYLNDELIFTEGRYEESHASTICETTRGLVTAWISGNDELDLSVWSSYHDGNRWSGPVRVADGVQYTSESAGLRYPCWNPVLSQLPGDAPTLLFFKVGSSPGDWWGETMVSFDRGRNFANQRRLPQGIIGPLRSKPLRISDDHPRLLCGSSSESNGWKTHVESAPLIDGDLQPPWTRIEVTNAATRGIPAATAFLNHRDGRVQLLCQTDDDFIATSFSSDQGKSWSAFQATDLANNHLAFDAVTLSDGRHLLIYQRTTSPPTKTDATASNQRHRLSAAISSDGQRWILVGDLDSIDLDSSEEAVSYDPAVIQTADGKVHVTHTWKRRAIKHSTLDPARFRLDKSDGDQPNPKATQ